MLIAETFLSVNNIKNFRCAEKQGFQVNVIVRRLVSLLRCFKAGHAFPLKHLINQAFVQFRGEDKFTDSKQFYYIPRTCLLNRSPVPAVDLKSNRNITC